MTAPLPPRLKNWKLIRAHMDPEAQYVLDERLAILCGAEPNPCAEHLDLALSDARDSIERRKLCAS